MKKNKKGRKSASPKTAKARIEVKRPDNIPINVFKIQSLSSKDFSLQNTLCLVSRSDIELNNWNSGQRVIINAVSNDESCLIEVGVVWADDNMLSGTVSIASSSRLSQFADSTHIMIKPMTRSPIVLVSLTCQAAITSDVTFNTCLRLFLLQNPFIPSNWHTDMLFFGRKYHIKLLSSDPHSIDSLHLFTNTTRIIIKSDHFGNDKIPEYNPFSQIGGLENEISQVRKIIEWALLTPEKLSQFNLKPPKGVLLFGPAGTGKTLLARAIASQSFAKMFIINGPEIISKFVGESEQLLCNIFAEASENSPSIIFIDEIDAICPKRSEAIDEFQKRVVATMLTLMDGLKTDDRVVIIGATNLPNTLDPAIRRPGRFDREIEIGIPGPKDRLDILKKLIAGLNHCLTTEQLNAIADVTHGFVGADIKFLIQEAALLAQNTQITFAHFNSALALVKPSVMRQIVLEIPKVHWNDIGGQELVKKHLRQVVEWPLIHSEAFARLGISPPKGILLYGPPGCSKTMMAKALATESSRNFIAIKGPELFSKWVGDSEKAVQDVFRKARAASPSIIFFDEIDSISAHRSTQGQDGVQDRVLSQLLIEMDGILPLRQVTILAATNRPDLIDSALLRPGRFDRLIYVPPPDKPARREIFAIHLRSMPFAENASLDVLAEMSGGFSGAEIASSCRKAALIALEQDASASSIELDHLKIAIQSTKPAITNEIIQFYDSFSKK